MGRPAREDETGLANLIIRPDLCARRRAVLHAAEALVARGVVQREGAAASLLVGAVRRLAGEPNGGTDDGGRGTADDQSMHPQ